MKRFVKWLAIGVGGLVGLTLATVVVLSFKGNAQFKRTWAIEPEPVPVPADDAGLARGEHVVDFFCRDCHGEDLTGTVMFEAPGIATVNAPNITGLADTFSDADLVRVIRHGVARDGRQLMIMPADALIYLSREDLGAAIAYLRTVPRAGEDHPTPRITLMGKALLGAGVFGDVFPAELTDHETPFPPMPEIGPNVATGEYLTRFCRGCHGTNLEGRQPPDPASPYAPTLAGVTAWSEEDFIAFTQTGQTPYGRHVDPNFMPVRSLGKLDVDEVRGMYRYLNTRR